MKETRSAVTLIDPAPSSEAALHYARALALETDCSDVHHAMTTGNVDFVLLDVRSPELFAKGHVRGARNLPYARINEQSLLDFKEGTLFVVYCSGPHCNGADKAALKLAKLGRPVKKMIGGITGWLDEAYPLDS